MPPTTLPPGIQRGKKYRFLVKSAEEAIHIIRTRLGEEAKVLSVKQVEGQGLSRFLSSPKLEIIATIPQIDGQPVEESQKPAPQNNELSEKGNTSGAHRTEQREPAFRLPEEPPADDERKQLSPQPSADESIEDDLRRNMQDEGSAAESAPRPFHRESIYSRESKPAENRQARENQSDVWQVLSKAGFADNLIQSLRFTMKDEKLAAMPLPQALAEIGSRLRDQYASLEPVALTRRIAFLGSPGVGKTTALCKRLAHEVFIERKDVQVLKLDGENPNPDDGLSVFCDVLGVPLLRDPVDPEDLPESDLLYLDLPGASLQNHEEWRQMRNRLDALDVRTRVLVVHACYESSMIASAFELGVNMRATHLVFTHIDELPNVTKLWPFLLRGGLSPFFLSLGQNVTSEYTTSILDEMIGRTFPAGLVR